MQKLKQFIPNLFTLSNLFCGIVGIYFVTQTPDLQWSDFIHSSNATGAKFDRLAPWAFMGSSCLLILLAGLFDFFDGMIARMLKVDSPLGAELDSLADVVSFGVLPGFILFQLMKQTDASMDFMAIATLLPLCGAYRLAKFNIDTEQSEHFKGLAIPSMALFIVGLAYELSMDLSNTSTLLNKWLLAGIAIVFGYLMVSNIPMFSFKMKSFDWKTNWFRYVLLIASVLLFIRFNLGAFAFIIPLYILLSLITRNQFVPSKN